MTFTLDQAVIAAFLAFCRIGGCMLVMPGISSIRVSVQVRLFFAVALTAALLVHLWDQLLPYASGEPAALVAMAVSETLTGVLIGLLARIYILAVQFMGATIAMMMGFGGMVGSAIEEPEPQAALAAVISFSALLLIFVLNFHHEIIRALVVSYSVAPPNVLFSPQSALNDVTDTISDAFFVMLRLGSPFIAYGLLVNFAIGILNKLTPQIPVYFISLPFVIAGGLLLLYFGVETFLSLMADGFIPTTVGR